MFIGREEELKRIRKRLKLDSLQAVLVYGRRRIGKTELINKAIELEKVRCLPLLARKVNESMNLDDFSNEAAIFMDNISFHPRDFYEFYATLIEYSKNNPFVLFIDEYCFLKDNNNGFDSYLQKAIELHKKDAKITIILCGSYIETMKQIVERNSPLYGRFNEEILLHSFNYYDAAKFSPAFLSIEDKFKYYACFGGTAFNLSNLDYSIPFEENLINEFIKIESFFEKEAVAVIKGEIEKENNVNTVFELIARGVKKYKELNDFLGDPSKDNVGRYIRKLEGMDLIDKTFAVDAKSERKPLYFIKDNMLDFYYKFLFKNSRIRASMSPKVFFDKFVKKELYETYLPHKFEEIVKEYCILNNGGTVLPFFNSIGRLYYNKDELNREFDVVLSTDDGLIPIECKYSKNLVSQADVNEEIYQWEGLPYKVFRFGFASKSGFSSEIIHSKELLLIEFSDLFK